MDIIFAMHKIKYTSLDRLFIDFDLKKNINLYINIEDVISKFKHSFFTIKSERSIQQNTISLVSNIINLAAHYKVYFSRKNKNIKIFIYGNYPLKDINPSNREILESYRLKYYNFYSNDVEHHSYIETINNTIPMVLEIIKYIPDIYFIPSGTIESSLVPKILSEDNKGTNIILTTDRYEYQYVNHDFYILKIQKKDNHKLLTTDNIIKQLSIEYDLIDDYVSSLSALNIPILYSFTGDIKRSIPNIKFLSMKRAVKIINTAIEKNIISKDISDISSIIEYIDNKYRVEVSEYFNVIDIHSQISRVSTLDKLYINDFIIDKFDISSLKELNEKYFTKNHFMIMELNNKHNFVEC